MIQPQSIEIINYIFRNEKVKSFRSIIDIIYNNELLAKYINDPESLDLLNRYFKINNIHLDFIKKSDSSYLLSNKINIGFIYNLKKLYFNGEELSNIFHLVNINIVKNNIDQIIGSGSLNDPELLTNIDKKIKIIKESYESARSQYSYYIDKCNNIEIKKHYNDIIDLTNHNNKDVLADIEFDNTLNDLVIFYNFVKTKTNSDLENVHIKNLDNYDDLIENFRMELSYNYIFLGDSKIDKKLSKIVRIIESGEDDDLEYFDMIKLVMNLKSVTLEDKLYLRDINPSRFSLEIENGDMALLLKKDNDRFLFHRINKHWIGVDKDSYDTIDKCFNLDKSILMLNIDQIDEICKLDKISLRDDDLLEEKDKCIRFGEYHIPEKLYKLHLT